MDRIIEKKPWYKKPSTWITVGIILLLVLLYSVFLLNTDSKLNVDKEKLSIARVDKDFFQDYMATIGSVYPIRTIYLDAIEGGRVEELVVEEGSMVEKGDIILRLSNPNLNLSIMNNEAELAEKANFLRNTQLEMEQDKLDLKKQIIDLKYKILKQKRDYQHKKQFYEKGLIAKDEFLAAKENYFYSLETQKLLNERQTQDSIYRRVQVRQLKESLARMQENLELVRKKMENLEVKAPVSGQLGLLDAEIGEQKKQGERLGIIHVLDAYKIQADIDEHYISRVTTGLRASFNFNNETYELTVRKVYPEVRNGRFKIDMKFVSEMPENIRTGQTFKVKVELGEPEKAILLRRGGFYQSTGGQWAYVLDPSGKFATKQNIKIGRQNPKYYEIISGLKEGDKVIISGYDNFGDADKLIFK